MKRSTFLTLLVCLSTVLVLYISKATKSNNVVVNANDEEGHHYNLGHPAKKYNLPGKLNEISGLTYISNYKIGCIEDEKGNIYVFDIKKGKLTKKIDFAKDRDYEGIEIVKKTAYVLRSNGDIYIVKKFGNKKQEVKKYNTFLQTSNNAEGLGYDPVHHRLLIACKGVPGKGKSLKGAKTVYGFDLDKKKLKKKPVYVIDVEAVEEFLVRGVVAKVYQRVLEFFQPGKNITFQPSGISIHPLSGEIYIISSVGKLMVVLSSEGQIQHIYKLDPTIFKQPEGITFSENGDIYISNEFKGGKPNLLKFTYNIDEK